MQAKVFFTIIIMTLSLFLGNNLSEAYQSADNIENQITAMSDRVDEIWEFKNLHFSFDKQDILFGFGSAFFSGLIMLAFFSRRHNFRAGEEHGSARWGTARDIAKYKDKKYENNMLFTKTEHMSLNTRQTMRNNNVLVVGGSGSGKTRFFLKPNLMQMHSSYVITDPNGYNIPR